MLTGAVVWSDSLQAIFGYEAQEPGSTIDVSYQWWSDRIHPSDRLKVLASIESTIKAEDGEVWSMEYRFLKADGTYAFVPDRGCVARNEQGQAIRMVGSMQDITTQKLAEEELWKREELLRQALHAAQMTAWEWDPTTNRGVRYGQLSAITGLPEEAAVGTAQQFFDLIHPEDRDRRLTLFQTVLKSRGGFQTEFRIVRTDGSIRWVADRGRALVDRDDCIRLMGVTVDMTARKQAEEETRRMNEGIKK